MYTLPFGHVHFSVDTLSISVRTSGTDAGSATDSASDAWWCRVVLLGVRLRWSGGAGRLGLSSVRLDTVGRLMRAEYGQAVRVERKRRGMGLRELARRVRCSPGMMSDIELGKRLPGNNLAAAIRAELGDFGGAAVVMGILAGKLPRQPTREQAERIAEVMGLAGEVDNE